MLYSKHAIPIILLYLTGAVASCMPANTSELRIPFGRSQENEKESVRRAPVRKSEPSSIKITIKDQEQVRAKTFTQVKKNQTEDNSSEPVLEKEELVITRGVAAETDREATVDNVAIHRAAFQRARAFRSKDISTTTTTSTTSTTSTTTTTTTTTTKPSKTSTISELPTTTPTTKPTTTTPETSSKGEGKVKPARAQASKTLSADKTKTVKKAQKKEKIKDSFFNIDTEMCNNCPDLLFPVDGGLKKVCKNWQALEKNFKLAMDPQKPKMENAETITSCSRKVTCSSPHAILKWSNFPICDILTETASDLSFTFRCNGSHWSMNDFPIEAVSCVIKND